MNNSFTMQNDLWPESDDVSIFERTFRRASMTPAPPPPSSTICRSVIFFPLAAKTRLKIRQVAEVENIAKLDIPAGA